MDPNAVAPQVATPPNPQPTPPTTDIYPSLVIPHIQNPSRLYAFPILGFLIKAIILIPVGLWTLLLSLLVFAETIVNSFVVLFTGRYWPAAHHTTLGFMRLSARTTFFWYGLTNKYPGFSLENTGDVVLDMPIPENPGRLYAIPLIGILIRTLLLIPYAIYTSIIVYASYIGAFISFIPVLFMGKYPESTYELGVDGVRLNMSAYAYTFGLSDKYPSFHISWNHKVIKIILIALGALLFLGNVVNSFNDQKEKPVTPTYSQNVTPAPADF